jgi:hypothetical protein
MHIWVGQEPHIALFVIPESLLFHYSGAFRHWEIDSDEARCSTTIRMPGEDPYVFSMVSKRVTPDGRSSGGRQPGREGGG